MKNTNLSEAKLMRSDFFAVFISLVAAALIFLPLFTSAKGKTTENAGQVYMYSLNGSRASVTLTNLSEGKYTISVENLNGTDVFYNESIYSPEKFAKVFDFSRLEDGDYTVIVKSNNVVREKHFEIKNGEVKIKNELSEVPSFKSIEGSKALIEMTNTNNRKVSIKVYSPDGEELYSNVESTEIRKFFDFSKVENGNYAVMVSTNDNSFQFNYIKE